jgi:hypothetical protein
MKYILIISMIILSSCGKSIPSANDSDVKQLVLEICDGEFKKANPAVDWEFELSAIRLTSQDEDVGKISCAAQLSIKGTYEGETIDKTAPITYTAQYTGDGQLYVEVFGLN